MSAPPTDSESGGYSEPDSDGDSFDLEAVLSTYHKARRELLSDVTTHRAGIADITCSPQQFKRWETLDLEPLGMLPNLRSLSLTGIRVASIVLTSSNAPKLTSINLSRVALPHEHYLRFELELPELRSLNIEHVAITGDCDFGLSLSRCPNLREVTTYELYYLEGPNFCVLPKCTRVSLHRSLHTDNLEVLQAPRLRQLSVDGAFAMSNLRVWDMRCRLDAWDVEEVVKECEYQAKRIKEDVEAAGNKWKNGRYGGKKGYKRGWIEREYIDEFKYESDEEVQSMVEAEVEARYEKRYKAMKQVLVQELMEDLSEGTIGYMPKKGYPSAR